VYVYYKNHTYRSLVLSVFFKYFAFYYTSLVINFFLKYLTILSYARTNNNVIGSAYEHYLYIGSCIYILILCFSVYFFIRLSRLFTENTPYDTMYKILHIPLSIVFSGLVYWYHKNISLVYSQNELTFKYIVLTVFIIGIIEVYFAATTLIQSRFIEDLNKKKAVRFFAGFYGVMDIAAFLFLLFADSIEYYYWDYIIRFSILILFLNAWISLYFTNTSNRIINEAYIRSIVQSYNLSDKQVAVIIHVCSGKTNKEIAWELSTSERTIKYHLNTIFTKIGVSSRMELINKVLS